MKLTGSLLLMFLFLFLSVCEPASGYQVQDESSPSASAPDPDFSPRGPFTGPLVIPHIARFRELPNRMNLDPLILPPDTVFKIDEQLVPLFERILQEATDEEIQEVAALSLARVAEENLADISRSGTALLKVLKSSEKQRLCYACAHALAVGNVEAAAPELIQSASEGSDDQRLLIEPALARWKVRAAADLWRPRLKDTDISEVSFRLAAEGLAALDDAVSLEPLSEIVADSTADFGKRMAAAKAAALLDPEQAFAAAGQQINGSVQDRLLAIALLDNTKAESHVRTSLLCDDPTDAVASAAWQQVFRRSPENLVSHLAAGRVHGDAQVRMTAARVMELFPNAERTAWLDQQLSDVHIEVRNVARQMLVIVATENPDLKDQIAGRAADALQPDSKDWQGTEQSLVLLGQLRATQFSPLCVPLLSHPRSEVNISASWLIHLFPDESIRDAILGVIRKNEETAVRPPLSQGDSGLVQCLLIQYAGLVRMREIQPMLETKFNKMAPGGLPARTASMWALGILFEKTASPELAAKFEERIKDRTGSPAEWPTVRRASVLALGLLRATDSSDVVFDAFSQDSLESLIPGTARWVLPLLGQPMPAEILPREVPIGGWRINLVEDSD